MLGDRLNAVGVPNQALLFRRLQGLQHLVNGRAEIKRLAEIAAKVHRPSSPACVLAVLFVLNFDNQLHHGYSWTCVGFGSLLGLLSILLGL
jgi:hypothetical protein